MPKAIQQNQETDNISLRRVVLFHCGGAGAERLTSGSHQKKKSKENSYVKHKFQIPAMGMVRDSSHGHGEGCASHL